MQVTEQSGTREHVMSSALEMFAVRGFRGTSTRAIADHAGVSQPVVHYHFRSKAALFEEVLEKSVDAWVAQVEEILGSGVASPTEVLRQTGAAVLDQSKANRLLRSLGAEDDQRLVASARSKLTAAMARVGAAIAPPGHSPGPVLFAYLTALSEVAAMGDDEKAVYGFTEDSMLEEGVAMVLRYLGIGE